eukprot:TRINITY_DN2446_c0_g1_i1.p1 TRINITY_DN2446_c0_g1~~TRINITY_DN2446_c0_g1_i1.p1  ORF type:complete len:351 (-),score=74.74 TRINITY_DN2446_c0_g1_i1:46-1098(-)
MSIRIVSGTYERQLFGFVYNIQEKTAHTEFAYTAHLGCVKALAVRGNLLVSGSTDENVKIYNLKTLKEHGSLIAHEGSINCMQFHAKSHLICGSSDSKISLWRTKDWENLITLRAHKNGVNSISIHPSGKIALSTGRDSFMRLWDLMSGRLAHATKLPKESELVQWSPSGDTYAYVMDNSIVVQRASDPTPFFELKEPRRVIALAYYQNDHIIFGGEENVIKIVNIKTKEVVKVLSGHANRIRSISVVSVPSAAAKLVVSASSDGTIRVWDPEHSETELTSLPTNARLTCMTAEYISDAGDSAPLEAQKAPATSGEDMETSPAKKKGDSATSKRPLADDAVQPKKKKGTK